VARKTILRYNEVTAMEQGLLGPKLAPTALLLSILFGASGQLLMKHAALLNSIAPPTLATVAILLMALAIYSIGIGCWILALRTLPLAVAYPVTSLSYIGILWGSSYCFGESITALRMIGVALVFLGVVLVVLRDGTAVRIGATLRRRIRSP